MIIKTFRASSSSAALKQVREQMGGDAIVLKSTQTNDDKMRPVFEVTACLEKPSIDQTSKIFPDQSATTAKTVIADEQPAKVTTAPKQQIEIPVVEKRLNKTPQVTPKEITNNSVDDSLTVKLAGIESMLNQLLKTNSPDMTAPVTEIVPTQSVQLREMFRQHDFNTEFSDLFIANLEDESNDDVDLFIKAQWKLVPIVSDYMLPHVEFLPGETVAFVGPAGCGKSSVMGKLAADLILRKKQIVTLRSLDTTKIGAFDEINAYGEILNAKVKHDEENEEQTFDDSITLIDTPAMSLDKTKREELKNHLLTIRPNYIIAVVSALIRNSDLEKFAAYLDDLRPTHLAITMTDLTDCKGIYFNGPQILGKKIIFTTNTPGGAGELHSPDPARLVRDLLNLEVDSE